MSIMGRIVIALLFAFAAVNQSALLGANQHGIRSMVVAAQPSKLTEYTECDDTDHSVLFLSAIAAAAPALEQLAELAFIKNLHQPQHSHRHSVPLFKWHAVWRI